MNIFHTTHFSGMKWWTMWFGNVIVQSPRKMSFSSGLFQRSIMVYWMIIGVIFHLFIICCDWWCHFPFFEKTFSHNRSAIFGEMCRSTSGCLDVKTQILWHRSSDLDNIGLSSCSCGLNRLNKHSMGRVTRYDVPLLANPFQFNWRVPPRVPLFPLGLWVLGATVGGC